VRRAGKTIIQYHGWADAAISPEFSLRYRQAVEERMGVDVSDFYRLFMVPGMGHCGGGPGPNTLLEAYGSQPDAMDALVRWVEQRQPPAYLNVSKHRNDDPGAPVERTVHICAFSSHSSIGIHPMKATASGVCE